MCRHMRTNYNYNRNYNHNFNRNYNHKYNCNINCSRSGNGRRRFAGGGCGGTEMFFDV